MNRTISNIFLAWVGGLLFGAAILVVWILEDDLDLRTIIKMASADFREETRKERL